MYNQRCRICEHHHHAPEIDIDGQPMRFCHRCAALQPLVDFKGSQRSCMASLQRHKELKQQRMQVRIRVYKRSAGGCIVLDADCLQGTTSQPAMVALSKQEECKNTMEWHPEHGPAGNVVAGSAAGSLQEHMMHQPSCRQMVLTHPHTINTTSIYGVVNLPCKPGSYI